MHEYIRRHIGPVMNSLSFQMNILTGTQQTICWGDFLAMLATFARGIEGTESTLLRRLVQVLRVTVLVRGVVDGTLGISMMATIMVMVLLLANRARAGLRAGALAA